MHAFLRRFLMHYGIYRRSPSGRFPAQCVACSPVLTQTVGRAHGTLMHEVFGFIQLACALILGMAGGSAIRQMCRRSAREVTIPAQCRSTGTSLLRRSHGIVDSSGLLMTELFTFHKLDHRFCAPKKSSCGPSLTSDGSHALVAIRCHLPNLSTVLPGQPRDRRRRSAGYHSAPTASLGTWC
jgi:hypothetical protein